MARHRKRAQSAGEQPEPRQEPLAAAESEADGDAAPAPILHATPDVEIAEAHLAQGRAEAAGPELVQSSPDEEEAPYAGNGASGGGTLAVDPRHAAAPAPSENPSLPERLAGFLRGSWRELQRVQWPDRRQVVQATGVVIGFVIVAGVFLGVADWAAGKVVTYILK